MKIGKFKNVRIFTENRIKKTSLFFIEGSMTVEAAIVLPLFMIFFINLACAVNMIRLHSNLCVALWDTGNNLSLYGSLITDDMINLGKTGHVVKDDGGSSNANDDVSYETDITESDEKETLNESTDETTAANNILSEIGDLVVSYAYIKNKIIDFLGDDYLNSSPLVDGCDGLQFYESEIITSDDTVDINLTYEVSSLIDIDGFVTMRMSNCYYSHLWNGYDVCGESEENTTTKTVFITENSNVYHTSSSCTYLKLSVRAVAFSNISNERNSDGRQYSSCTICATGREGTVAYVCDEGGKYHFSRDCPSLKRNYSAVSLSSVESTHRPCSRCGGD